MPHPTFEHDFDLARGLSETLLLLVDPDQQARERNRQRAIVNITLLLTFCFDHANSTMEASS